MGKCWARESRCGRAEALLRWKAIEVDLLVKIDASSYLDLWISLSRSIFQSSRRRSTLFGAGKQIVHQSSFLSECLEAAAMSMGRRCPNRGTRRCQWAARTAGKARRHFVELRLSDGRRCCQSSEDCNCENGELHVGRPECCGGLVDGCCLRLRCYWNDDVDYTCE